MNVLFLDQFSDFWGAQRCMLDLVTEIQRRGWTAAAALPGHGPLVEHLRRHDVRVIPISCGPYRSGSKTIPDSIRFGRDLRSQVSTLRALEFDLVYVNGPRLLPAAAFAFGGRTPVLFHAHSLVADGPSKWLARWSLQKTDATVVACCNAVAPDVPSDKLRIIRNGTPDLGFRERTFDSWRIGIAGRISPQKGQPEFLQAARRLTRDFPGARFVICGAPIDSELRKLAGGLPVDFLGWRDDMVAVLANLDLLAIPSKQEGMPRVMLEAFSAGVPVVAFPVGGIPEVIADGETGFLTPEGTAEALAARIREIMLLGSARVRTVVHQARREWERRYTVETYRKNITDLMELVVSDRPAKHGIESLQVHR